MPRLLVAFASTVAASALLSVVACDMGQPAAPADDRPIVAKYPFEAEPPRAYVAKVKNVLVGLPPTDDEVKAVEADPTQLAGLIDGWMALPEYQSKMLRFFELAFQQTQVAITDFATQVTPRQADANGATSPLLVEDAQQSFARTMLALIAQGRPLTDAMTTQSFMMTPALMELYAFIDSYQLDDNDVVTDAFKVANPDLRVTVEAAQGPIPISETLDPTSVNYMHWYDPDIANGAVQGAGCEGDPITYPASGISLHYLLFGALDARHLTGGVACSVYGGTARAPQLTASDFESWKMVTIRQPHPGEPTTRFYDLATLRSTDTLVLNVPRVGFFTTPAFFANWQTNSSNEMRVTTNQALIVATGAMVDGNDTTSPVFTPGLDSTHAAAGTACYGCHRLLDPTRSIFAATYSWDYHTQTDATFSSQPGLFSFEGVTKPVSSIADFGAALASHPLVAQAWADKLCFYANSTACEADDPEFQRVVDVFRVSGYQWNTLVRTLMSSPLTTYAKITQSAGDQGEIAAVERRDHLCAALDARFGFADICALDPATVQPVKTSIPAIVSGLPSDGYGRGAVAPVLPNQPTLFFRAGTENICEALSALVVDASASSKEPGVAAWSSKNLTGAIADFVSVVMGLTPSDPRSAPAASILSAHYGDAVLSGARPTDALRSTFVAACLAPSSVSIGL